MANINTPITAAATNTQVEDTVQNPTTTTPATWHGNTTVHIDLIFGPGVNVDPNQIYDMIDGTFATVASQKESVARGTYIFRIDS